MAESGGILRQLIVMLGFDVDGGGLKKAEVAIEGIKGALEKLAMVAEGALIGLGLEKTFEWLQSTAEAAENVAHAAERIGMSTDQFQKLAYVAQQVDMPVDSLAKSFTFLERSIYHAKEGSEEAQKAFSSIGIKLGDLKSKNPQEIFEQVADAFKDIEDPAKKSAIALQILGRGGAELIPLLDRGSEAIREFGEEAKQLGVIQGKEFFETSEKFMHGIKAIKAALTASSQTAAPPLLATVTKSLDRIVKWWKEYGERVLNGIANIFGVIASVLGAVLDVLAPIVAGWGELFALIFSNTSVVQGLAAALGLVMVVMFPLIALFALVALALEDIYGYFEGSDSYTGDFVNAITKGFAKLKDPIMEYWDLFKSLFDATTIVDLVTSAFDATLAYVIGWFDHLVAVVKAGVASAIDAAKQAGGDFLGSIGLGGLGNAVFGGGAAPAAAAAASSNTSSSAVSNNSNFQAQIQINAAPGMSAEDVAGTVSNALSSWHDDTMRETYSALIPAAR